MDLSNLISYLKEFWPALATLAGSFAFPFVSQLRKDTFHFSDRTRRISNTLAGIATACVVLLLLIERHSLHLILANFPRWYWLVGLGVALISLHSFMVQSRHALAKEGASKAPQRAIEFWGLVVYVLAFVALAFGFNQPMFRHVIFIPIAGTVQCAGVDYVDLVRSDHTIAQSPVADDRYQFLLRPHEIESGLDISILQTEVIIDASTTQPQLDLNISCDRA